MKLKPLLLLFLFLNISLNANNTLSVMTYNLENFFDTYDDPGKDDKAYLPLTAKQDQGHIDACNKIRVSKWKNECLHLDWNEENKNKKLNDVGYVDYVLIEGNDYRGIDNAYLSKYKIKKTKQHKIIFSPKFSTKDTRPILEAVIDVNGKPIHFYNVHFPAPYNPIGMRRDAFNTLKKITSSHSNAVIALGDFNVTSFEAEKNETFVLLDKNWDISHITGCANCLGSHYYRRDDNWSFLDVIIIKENRGIAFENKSINVLKTNINTNKEGKPLSFNVDNGIGVSDHLPVVATILIN